MDALDKFLSRAARLARPLLPAVGRVILLALTAASTPYAAEPFHSPCAADPIPAVAWAVFWYPREAQFALDAGRELLARAEYPAAAWGLVPLGWQSWSVP